MDNLDRTNVVQSLLARRSLLFQLSAEKQVDLENVLETPWKSFESRFKTLWVNNANAMSFNYAGTGALKVDFTKTGKRTFKGMMDDAMNSCMRYYLNNFTDGVKQDAIDLILLNYQPDILANSPFSHKCATDNLWSSVTKSFVLFVSIFVILMLAVPPILTQVILKTGININLHLFHDKNFNMNYITGEETDFESTEMKLKHLSLHLLVAISLTFLVLLIVIYKIMKVGSSIGESLVVKPELLPL